ncbi:MAG: hypothetical protein E7549_01155 [Ruminococcaceae bacterium]|nr:hypothetical protein [Oscillospiraceae bacterium]
MLATLVGYRPVDFTDDTGRKVVGTSLYIVYTDDNARGLVGQVACKVFYQGSVKPDWVGQAIKLEYSFNPSTKTARLVDVKLADYVE